MEKIIFNAANQNGLGKTREEFPVFTEEDFDIAEDSIDDETTLRPANNNESNMTLSQETQESRRSAAEAQELHTGLTRCLEQLHHVSHQLEQYNNVLSNPPTYNSAEEIESMTKDALEFLYREHPTVSRSQNKNLRELWLSAMREIQHTINPVLNNNEATELAQTLEKFLLLPPAHTL